MKKLNKFDKVFALIMEQIEGNDIYSQIKKRFVNNFKQQPSLSDEVCNEIIDKALEISRRDFQDALDSEKLLDRAWLTKPYLEHQPYEINGVKIISIDGDEVEFQFRSCARYHGVKFDLKSDTPIKMKIGDLISLNTVKYISNETNKRVRDERIRQEKETLELKKSRAEQAKNAMNVPGFKEFLDEVKSKSSRTPEEFDELFKNQTKEVKEAYIAYKSAESVRDSNLMYADGPAYYQQLDRDEDAERGKEKFIKHLESML